LIAPPIDGAAKVQLQCLAAQTATRAEEDEQPNSPGANFLRRNQIEIVLVCDGT